MDEHVHWIVALEDPRREATHRRERRQVADLDPHVRRPGLLTDPRGGARTSLLVPDHEPHLRAEPRKADRRRQAEAARAAGHPAGPAVERLVQRPDQAERPPADEADAREAPDHARLEGTIDEIAQGSRRGSGSHAGNLRDMARVKLVLVLSENWTLTSPRDLRSLVRVAVEAEDAGIDAVMVSEHIVLGASAGEAGLMANPREYALPGNQDPATPWPSSLVLLSGITAATTRLRLVAGAVIPPLRHPLLLARELGSLDLLSEGRLVVLPTVSWHRDEYEALGVPFGSRGALLDEHLAAWDVLWRDSPASFEGAHYRFSDVWLSRRRTARPAPCCGSAAAPCTSACSGGSSATAMASTRSARRAARSSRACERRCSRRPEPDELEMVGGIRGTFPDDDSVADSPARSRRFPDRSNAGTPRSASSRTSTPTTLPPSGRCAARSSDESRRSDGLADQPADDGGASRLRLGRAAAVLARRARHRTRLPP